MWTTKVSKGEKTVSILTYMLCRFSTHNHPDKEITFQGTFHVSIDFTLPLVFISDLPPDSTMAAVEALMPSNGSTVVRVECRSRPAWKGLAVEFESFAALDAAMKSHARKPSVLGGVTLGMATQEPPSAPPTPNSHDSWDYNDRESSFVFCD